MKRNLFVITGARISKPSEIPTFRDKDYGLWHKYPTDKVATHIMPLENN